MAHWLKVAGIATAVVLVAVAILSFAPSGDCNVADTVQMSQSYLCIATVCVGSYSVGGSSAQSDGYSPIIDWSALVGGISFSALDSAYHVVVCYDGQLGCHTFSETKFNPLAGVQFSQSITDTFTLGYVPPGQHTVSATLYVNGQNEGVSTTSLNVGC